MPPRQTILKIINDSDGRRRVVLFANGHGQFGFEEQHFVDDPHEMSWIPCHTRHVTICDSLETAEREARSRVEWLAQ